MINNVPATILDFPPDDEAEFVRQLSAILRGKSVQEVALIRRCCVDMQPDATVEEESGVSAEVITRLREKAASDASALRDLLQPPHAAD
jgi:hypothetical protein